MSLPLGDSVANNRPAEGEGMSSAATDQHGRPSTPPNHRDTEASPLISPASSRQTSEDGLRNTHHIDFQNVAPAEPDNFQKTKSLWYLVLLTIPLGGLQIAWSVELSNGSPYLLSLGLSKSLMALVWIAGPLSGTIVQPYVGMLSDRCRISWGKRKPFMLGGSAATIISLLMLAWTKDIVAGTLGLFGADAASEGVKVSIIVIAVAWVYILDFAINTVQAAIRAFIVDCAPSHQQEASNAMASRIVGVGNILGYIAGFANLPRFAWWLGDTQFKDLCAIASIALGSTVLVAVIFIKERDPRSEGPPSKTRQPGVFRFFLGLIKNIRRLPPQIKQVCVVQFCAWIGFFPMLFYTSAYIGEIFVEPFLEENPNMSPAELDELYERATRVGTFALLIFSITSLITNLFLPFFIAPTYDSSPVLEVEAPGEGPIVPIPDVDNRSWTRHLVIPGLTLRRAWMLSQLLFTGAMFCTVFVRTVAAATTLIGFVGITWALTLWAPWAIISAEISRRDAATRAKAHGVAVKSHDHVNGHEQQNGNGAAASGSTQAVRPGLSGYSSDPDRKLDGTQSSEEETDQAGVILGIHNMAIAAPQIIATVSSSIIFGFLQKPRGEPGDHSIAVVLALGGITVGISAYFIHRMDDEPGVEADGVAYQALGASMAETDGSGPSNDAEAEYGGIVPDSPVSTRSRKSFENAPRKSLERATLARSQSFGGMDYA